METEVMNYIEEIKDIGDGSVRDGILDGIDQGYFHREIGEASYEYQQRVERVRKSLSVSTSTPSRKIPHQKSSKSTSRRAIGNSNVSNA